MEIAESWGKEPADLFGGNRLTWYFRYLVKRELLGEKIERDIRIAEAKLNNG